MATKVILDRNVTISASLTPAEHLCVPEMDTLDLPLLYELLLTDSRRQQTLAGLTPLPMFSRLYKV